MGEWHRFWPTDKNSKFHRGICPRVSPEFLSFVHIRILLVTDPLRNPVFWKDIAYSKGFMYVFIYILPQSTEISKST